jgi:phosphopantothenoylcysteine decarboxylase/phosphopantothenate--cysteine ligase
VFDAFHHSIIPTFHYSIIMNILITAGPTREHLDPIRFISNRSTGKMGFAVAQAATERGHTVTLIAGPVSLETPPGVTRVDVTSACEMLEAVQRALPKQDALVMSAAVADWRPIQKTATKLKKRDMEPVIHLVPNPDILKTILPEKGNRLFVGFAAETGDPTAEAQRKLTAKGLDMIVANDVTAEGAGFAVDTNRVTFFTVNGQPQVLPLQSKLDVGRAIIGWLEGRRSEG